MSAFLLEFSMKAKRLFTLKEAGEYLGRSVYSMRTLVWKGALPVIQDGRKMWVDLKDLDAYVENHKRAMI